MSDSDDEVEYETENFIIGEKTFSITTISFLPIQTLMKNREKEKEISGQTLWCGSLCIIHYLSANPNLLLNSVVIELGSGTGVLGMTCKVLGAKTVYLTDHDEISIQHMTSDSQQNEVEVNICRLDWFSPDRSIEYINDGLSSFSNNAARLLVLAGDVIYKSALIDPFFDTLIKLLRLPQSFLNPSVAYLCHVPRAGVRHEDVVMAARERNLVIEEIDILDERSTNGSSLLESSCLRYCPREDLDRAKLYKLY